MAERMLRRGLPRVRGGEPWPPAEAVAEFADSTSGAETPDVGPIGEEVPTSGVSTPRMTTDAAPSVSVGTVAGATQSASARPSATATPGVPAPSTASGGTTAGAEVAAEADAPSPASGIRRGLPRVPGGEPWPPAGLAPHVSAADTPDAGPIREESPTPGVSAPAVVVPAMPAPAASPAVAASAADAAGIPIRRGLPRTGGGDPWPPAGIVPLVAATVSEIEAAAEQGPESPVVLAHEGAPPEKTAPPIITPGDLAPLPFTRMVWQGSAPQHISVPASDRRRPTWTQAIAGLLGAAGLGILAAAAVAFVRALLSMPFMQDFLAAFPGEYHPAIEVAPGFAPWVGWQHFFNMFLIVLIIRSGLRVRSEKRPTVFWAPRGSANGKGKISLTLWFHQALDILWLVNGVVFIVLLFVTGHWVRIVPTSWEVLPNALSAALQYVSLDWPLENGWVNYNSLQQLAYFATVFLAAPLAAVTGFRMSGMWPKKAERLSKAYPVEWARAVHFPVMLYFVAFIVVHVALVMFTGFLRNLNHMFASNDAVTWTGFWVFVASLVVIAVAWAAARPLVLAPIAKVFGSVSGR